MRFLKCVAGYKRLNKFKIKEFNIYNLNDKITNHRKNWKYYILRMEEARLPKKNLILS